MTKHFYAVVTLAVVGLVCAPRPAHAQYFSVGTFQKPAVTGVQTVAHNLPAGCSCAPAAMICWMNGQKSGGATSTQTFYWGFGVADGGSGTSRSVSASSVSAVTSANAARRMAQAAITMVKNVTGTATLEAEADLRQPTPWDTTSFYVNWTNVTDTSGYIIHFLAIGAYNVSANAVDWTAPSGTGTKSVNSL